MTEPLCVVVATQLTTCPWWGRMRFTDVERCLRHLTKFDPHKRFCMAYTAVLPPTKMGLVIGAATFLSSSSAPSTSHLTYTNGEYVWDSHRETGHVDASSALCWLTDELELYLLALPDERHRAESIRLRFVRRVSLECEHGSVRDPADSSVLRYLRRVTSTLSPRDLRPGMCRRYVGPTDEYPETGVPVSQLLYATKRLGVRSSLVYADLIRENVYTDALPSVRFDTVSAALEMTKSALRVKQYTDRELVDLEDYDYALASDPRRTVLFPQTSDPAHELMMGRRDDDDDVPWHA